MNLSHWINRNAAFTPDKPAVVWEDGCLTYAEMDQAVAKLAAYLQGDLGLQQGQRVGWLGLNVPEMLILLFACARVGYILLPLNWRLTTAEHVYQLSDSEVAVLFRDLEHEQHCQTISKAMPGLDIRTIPKGGELKRNEPAGEQAGLESALLLMYSSGTTGRPKGVVLNQRAVLTNATMSQHMHDMTRDDRILTALPMFHVGGLNIQTTPALYCGATVYLNQRFDPDLFLKTLTSSRATLVVTVPATIRAMSSHPDWMTTDISSLRCMTTGSSVVPVPLIEAFESRGIPVLQVYGSTETCPIAVYQRFGGSDSSPHTTGKAGLLCELQILDRHNNPCPTGESGEVLIRGENILDRYWNLPEETETAFHKGWFRTGDIGHLDEQGRLTIDDRAKDMIISGGENIYPAEIERVLHEHPQVDEAAVIGIPDEKWGEVPLALVRVSDNVNANQLEEFCSRQLARYKVPRRYRVVDDFPRNSIGKVQKFKLRSQFNQ